MTVTTDFNSSVWNALWLLSPPAIVMAAWIIYRAWRKKRWFHFFDAKHNRGFAPDAGDFTTHWSHYEGLTKLTITLSAGAIAFLVNLLASQSATPNGFVLRIAAVAPILIGFFGLSIFSLIAFLLWMAYCYEDYCHRPNHDSYRSWKYALSVSLGLMGFIAFVLGFIWLAQNVFGRVASGGPSNPPVTVALALNPPSLNPSSDISTHTLLQLLDMV